jgi:hypothetical protein
MKASLDRLLFGTDEVVPETLPLRAGPLDLAMRGARIWHVRLDDVEIWHGAAFLFRDPDWGTPEPIVERIESTISEATFLIRCIGRFPTSPVVDFRFDLEGTRSGCVRFSGEAVPRADIQANRLGICVMHPLAAAGAPIEVEHTDGRSSRSTFPTLIPPWPPFMLIRAIRHEYAAGCWARCEFAGDSFELEDQRNNSDASFKIYSRSNLMPRPYWLRAGVPIRQSVELRLEASWTRTPSRRHAPAVAVRVGDEVQDLPKIGVEISPCDVEADQATRAALRAMRPAQLHLALETVAEAVEWKRINELLGIAGARLRLDLTVGDVAQADEVLEALRGELRDADLMPASIAVFPSEQRCLQAARRVFPASLIGGGTPHFFVQLNRFESLGTVDFLTFTTSPIVHGADDESVMLSLQSLPSMVETLSARYPDVPVRIGPSSIATRKSPLGSQPETDGMHRIALARQDPRCRGLYGAAWSLGYVAQLAIAGVDAITLMSLSGASGVLGPADGDAVRRYPAYFVLERLQAPARRCSVSVSEPSRIAAVALRRKVNRELLLANLTGDVVDVQLDGWAGPYDASIMDGQAWATVFSVPDAWNASRRRAQNSSLRLEPYAVASLEQHG